MQRPKLLTLSHLDLNTPLHSLFSDNCKFMYFGHKKYFHTHTKQLEKLYNANTATLSSSV
jgi:CMP-N-acetylneuraminic acid synthetase